MWNIIEFDKVTSTNEIAAQMLSRGQARHADVVQALHQTSGRGRGAGRVWMDEPGESLLMSIIIDRIPEPANLLQYRAALAVLDALRDISAECGKSPKEIILKWPNDILIRNKKVCGILLEAQWNAFSMRSAVIGIGVNVKQTYFPDHLTAIATSINQSGIVANVNKVRDAILDSIESEFYEANLEIENPISILDRLRVELEWTSALHSLRHTSVDGSVLADLNYIGLDDSGALQLRQADGSVIVVHSGSLSWAGQYVVTESLNG